MSYIRIFGFQRHLAAAFMFDYILHHLFWIQHLISLQLHMTHLKITKTTMRSSVCWLKLSFVCMPQQHRVSVPVKQCKCEWSYVKPDQRPATVAGAARRVSRDLREAWADGQREMRDTETKLRGEQIKVSDRY